MDINLEVIENYISHSLHTDLSEMLYIHKCYDLIIRMPNSSYYNKACQRYMYNKRRMEYYLQECQPILQIMKIPYAIVKGMVLSATAYGEPFIRHSGDIDILVAPQDVTTFSQILNEHGFVQGTISRGCIVPASREKKVYQTIYSHQLFPFVKKTENASCPYICIDANINVIWGESKNKIDMQELLSRRIKMKIGEIELYKLDPISEFIVLCLHHYKDMNSIYLLSQGSLKLKLFLDIYRYIQHQQEHLPIDLLRERASKWGVLQYVYYCVTLTAYLFTNPILDLYSKALVEEGGKRLLNQFGLSDDERKTWVMPLEERLFSPDFSKSFNSLLSSEDINKIGINICMMK